MKLVIISHTAHYRRDGEVVGWGPTVREIDEISRMFDRVVHIAPMHSKENPESALRYESPRIQLREVNPSGGVRVTDKLGILFRLGSYLRAIVQELRDADAVHVRCPANISLLALVILIFLRKPGRRWLKYAGSWCPPEPEPWSYTLQRWLLRRSWHRGLVTVNGYWPNQPSFVRSFFNPCLNRKERMKGRAESITKRMIEPVRLIFVGRLHSRKGVGRVLQIVARVKSSGCAVLLDVVGDGNERSKFEQMADMLGIAKCVKFHGWLSRAAINPLYSQAHISLLPSSSSEGWPKALSEAMAFGVVPLASNVSSIPQYLKKFGCGRAFAPSDVAAFADSILWYATHPEEWKGESESCVKAAELFDYRNHCMAVRTIFQIPVSRTVGTSMKSEALKV